MLVGDDLQDNQFLVERVLKKFDASVTLAHNGAIAFLKGKGTFDVMLMNIQMTEMNSQKPIIALLHMRWRRFERARHKSVESGGLYWVRVEAFE